MAASSNLNLTDRIGEHMVHAMTFDLGRYLIAATLITVIIWGARKWSEARRIQQRRAGFADYRREFLSSMRTVLVFALTTISTVLMKEAGWVEINLETFTWSLLALQFAVMTIAHDAYFYWMHRALHVKSLFRLTHLHHHKSRTPTPWAAYSFTSFEAVTEAAFVPLFLLSTSLLGFPFFGFAVFLFLAHMIFRNVIGHAGVEFMPAGWTNTKWLDWMTTTTHHDLHHSSGNHNFGLYFTWWDRWMNTEHPQYKARFNAVAKPLFGAQQPPVTAPQTLDQSV